VSGRLGYAWDRVLLYAKGGGAWVATNSPAISVAGRHPRHDWRHGPLSQVTKSSIASSVLIFERPPPPLNGEAIASPLNNPSKPNVTQTAFSVIEISPTSL
jgi:hypothetical protein